jgi:hypothetical protein
VLYGVVVVVVAVMVAMALVAVVWVMVEGKGGLGDKNVFSVLDSDILLATSIVRNIRQ